MRTSLELELGASFEIGDWLVEPDRLRVLRGDEVRKLEPMAMRLLVFLAGRRDRVVSRAEILEEVWEGRAVVDETLSRGISLIRQALDDRAQDPTYIETVPRRGYQVVAQVRPLNPETGSAREAGSKGPLPSEGSSLDDSPSRDLPPEDSVRLTRWRLAALLVILLALAALWFFGRDRLPLVAPSPPLLSEQAKPSPKEASRRQGIAVLPFKNISPDSASAYLAEGLTEELIHQLASVSGLRVVSRTSSMTFRASDATAPEIASILGVDYLLEGTVLVVGQRLRITAQLIQPDQDEHLLSRSYDRDFSEVLDLQREVAKDVVEQTRIKLSPMEADRLTRNRPIIAAAYRAYLLGYQTIQQRSDLEEGLDLLARSVELDPGFAPAWAALADAHLLSNSYLGLPGTAAYSGAETAISKALELDPELASAHTALGLLRAQRDRDWAGSEDSYRRSIELEPSNVKGRQWYSEVLSLIGRHEEALRQIEMALELDPLSPLIHAAAGQRLNAAGRHEEAISRLQDAEALGFGSLWILREKAWALQHLGRDQEALELLVALAAQLTPDIEDQSLAELHQETQDHGLQGFYRWDLQRLLNLGKRRAGYPTWVAAAYSGAGQKEEAFEWLEKATQERDLWLVHWLKNPAFDTIRDDPRFLQILGDIPPWRPLAAPSNRNP